LAAASLKRRSRLTRLDRSRIFPRPFGRGLIEASGSRTDALADDPFRGHLAAASLKQELAYARRKLLVAFRGHLAAASLKPQLRGLRPDRRPAFPRPFGRGLIEATRALHAPAQRPAFPRPFGRGLIEASLPTLLIMW
jgi:hypothetical protein